MLNKTTNKNVAIKSKSNSSLSVLGRLFIFIFVTWYTYEQVKILFSYILDLRNYQVLPLDLVRYFDQTGVFFCFVFNTFVS